MRNRESGIVGFWDKFREGKPSLIKAYRRQPALFLVFSLGFPPLCGLLYYLTLNGVCLVLFLMAIGGFIRDMAFALWVARDWRHVKKHLDWDRIDETLAKYRDE